MALGDFEVKGKLKVVGTTEMTGSFDLNGGALDTTLVTNLNADKVDSADLDTDGTLAANSDAKIPSQKAVKTYADARKAECVALTGDQNVAGVKTLTSIPVLPASDPTTDNQAVRKAYVDTAASVVHRTGAETIAGVKTFSNVPLLPTDTIITANINTGAVTGLKLARTFGDGSEVITAGSNYTPPGGIYMIAGDSMLCLQIQVSGTWYPTSGTLHWCGGVVWCDGANMRFHNFDTSSHTLYIKSLS